MNISLVIPAHNEEKFIGKCLEAALANAPANLLEVVVVNNASTDKTAEVAAKFPKVRVVTEKRKGLTVARQAGFKAAKGDLLAYIDADTVMPENWFNILNREFEKNPKLICLSGPYHYYDYKPPKWQEALMERSYDIYKLTKALVIGGNFVVTRDALEKIGGFDESIQFYGEDTDLAVRLKKVGKILFLREFYMNTSGRRFHGEGFSKVASTYALNYIWEVTFKKPLHKKYRDVRI